MEKQFRLMVLLSIFLLVLIGCSGQTVEYKAKKSDFEESVYYARSGTYMIGYIENELVIAGQVNVWEEESEPASVLDHVLKSEEEKLSEQPFLTYKDVEIQSKGDKYYIKAENGLSLEFQKTGLRTLRDEYGMEYYKQTAVE